MAGPVNPKQRTRGRGNNGGNPNRGNYSGGGHGGGHGGGGGGGPRHINVRTQVFDSNGPEGRIRGNAHQVMELTGTYQPQSYQMAMTATNEGRGPQQDMVMKMRVDAKRVGKCTAEQEAAEKQG